MTVERIKRAIIVAAGEGKRLRPVSLLMPKPLVAVNGVRMIETSIRALKANGIHEIYIVAGYKKEQFFQFFQDDPDIRVLENTRYLEGNNITSLYAAKDYLPGSFVIEGDLIISNPEIFDPAVEKSGYCVTYMEHSPEWSLEVRDGSICRYSLGEGENCYRLWGISMWKERDGEILSELVRKQVEEVRDLSVYWDEIALSQSRKLFDLGIREIGGNDIVEIDTFDELAEMDPSYKAYRTQTPVS